MNDVLDECRKHGGAYHVFVDQMSAGNVYVKCPTIAIAASCVGALHGRWFSGLFHELTLLFHILLMSSFRVICYFFTGRLVTAAYVPVATYHSLFPDSMTATTPL